MQSKRGPYVVIATGSGQRSRRRDSIIVRTPLDLIRTLDNVRTISIAILADRFAEDRAVAAFLRDAYPDLRLATVRWSEPSAEVN
jgi:hypothetical protein